jgi:hypothetical protein
MNKYNGFEKLEETNWLREQFKKAEDDRNHLSRLFVVCFSLFFPPLSLAFIIFLLYLLGVRI